MSALGGGIQCIWGICSVHWGEGDISTVVEHPQCTDGILTMH